MLVAILCLKHTAYARCQLVSKHTNDLVCVRERSGSRRGEGIDQIDTGNNIDMCTSHVSVGAAVHGLFLPQVAFQNRTDLKEVVGAGFR